MNKAASPRRRSIYVGSTMVVLGFVIAGFCAFHGISPVVSTLVSPETLNTPGSAELNLSSGTYMIYERTGTQSGGGGVQFTETSPVSLSQELVRVTSSSGEEIRTTRPAARETITRGSAVHTGAVEFRISEGGRYRVEVAGTVGKVLVGQTLGSTFGDSWPWLVGAGGGLLVAVVGGIVLVVGALRSPPRPALPPPGWYQDPHGPGLRYWDGQRWSVHQH